MMAFSLVLTSFAAAAFGDCDVPGPDCDGNGLEDSCEIASDPSLDCDQDGILDFCFVTEFPYEDCDVNLVPDVCELSLPGADTDGNGTLDVCDCGLTGLALPHPDPISGESFGRSVAIDGDRIVVGVRDGESCYVFRRDAGVWVFEQELISEDQNGDGSPDITGFALGWGQGVKIAGDTIAIGARLYNVPGTPPMFNAGIIVTFKLTDSGWVEESRLQPPGLGEADVFSQAMDFKETTIVTSAPGADDAGEKAGELHLFERSIYDGWTWRTDFRPDDLQPGDSFAASLSVNGAMIAAAATRSDDLGEDTGVVYLLEKDGLMFEVVDKIYSPDPFPFQEYGLALELTDDLLVVGAPYDSRLGPLQGMVGIHRKLEDGTWSSTVLRPDDLEDNQLFGGSVTVSGDRLIVGAPSVWSDPTITPPSAKIYVFKEDGSGQWVEERRFLLPTFQDSTLGLCLDLQGTEFVAGGLFDDRYGLNTGIARVFDLTPAIDCDGDGVCDLPQQYDPAFDCDGNGVIDSCEGYTEDDCDNNGVPDDCELADNDCNGNGRLDVCDIADGEGDKGCDGVLDICQCLADFNSSGVVSFEDLLVLISTWGACTPECPTDLDCDGEVGMSDILELLNAWGQCG